MIVEEKSAPSDWIASNSNKSYKDLIKLEKKKNFNNVLFSFEICIKLCFPSNENIQAGINKSINLSNV